MHFLCVTLGGDREKAIAEQFEFLNEKQKIINEPLFKVTFSKGVNANNLDTLLSIKEEIGDVLKYIGWLENDIKIEDLLRCINLCSKSERKVLACTFAHLRAMMYMVDNNNHGENMIDMIIEDNVRLDSENTYSQFNELKHAFQNHNVAIDLWYGGYLGRVTDLALVHPLSSSPSSSPCSLSTSSSSVSSSSSSPVPLSNNISKKVPSCDIIAPFPSGNIPLWGCYAYGISFKAFTCLIDEISQNKPSKSLFEAKRGSISKKGMITLPIDRMLPRRLRAHNFTIFRAIKPLVFRMPPPHPNLLINDDASSTSNSVNGFSSTIHPHLDIQFFISTTFQLKRTGNRTWLKHIWLLENEKRSVKLYEDDDDLRNSRVPFIDYIPPQDIQDSSKIMDAAVISTVKSLQGLLNKSPEDLIHLNKDEDVNNNDDISNVNEVCNIISDMQKYGRILSEHLGVISSSSSSLNSINNNTTVTLTSSQYYHYTLLQVVLWIQSVFKHIMKIQIQKNKKSSYLMNATKNINSSSCFDSLYFIIEKALCFMLRIFSRAGYIDSACYVLKLIDMNENSNNNDDNNDNTDDDDSINKNDNIINIDNQGLNHNTTNNDKNAKLSAFYVMLISTSQNSKARQQVIRSINLLNNKQIQNNKNIYNIVENEKNEEIYTSNEKGDTNNNELKYEVKDKALLDFFYKIIQQPCRQGNNNDDESLLLQVKQQNDEINIDIRSQFQLTCASYSNLTRYDLDIILIALIKQRHDNEINDKVNENDDKVNVNVNENNELTSFRLLLRDWFYGFSYLALYGPCSIIKDDRNSNDSSTDTPSSSLSSSSSSQNSFNSNVYNHYFPDMKSYLKVIEYLCSLNRSKDACWLLKVIANHCIGDLFTKNLSSSSSSLSSQTSSSSSFLTYESLFNIAYDMKEPIRTLLMGSCLNGDIISAQWALFQSNGIRNNGDKTKGLNSSIDLPLRVTRACLKNIGAYQVNHNINNDNNQIIEKHVNIENSVIIYEKEEVTLIHLAIQILEKGIKPLSYLLLKPYDETSQVHWMNSINVLLSSSINHGNIFITSFCIHLLKYLNNINKNNQEEEEERYYIEHSNNNIDQCENNSKNEEMKIISSSFYIDNISNKVKESMDLLSCIVYKYEYWEDADKLGIKLHHNNHHHEEINDNIKNNQDDEIYNESDNKIYYETDKLLFNMFKTDEKLFDISFISYKNILYGSLTHIIPIQCLRLVLRDCYNSQISYKRSGGGALKIIEKRLIWIKHVIVIYYFTKLATIRQKNQQENSDKYAQAMNLHENNTDMVENMHISTDFKTEKEENENEINNNDLSSASLYNSLELTLTPCADWLIPLVLGFRWTILYNEQRSIKDIEHFKLEIRNLIIRISSSFSSASSSSSSSPSSHQVKIKILNLLLSSCFCIYSLELLSEKSSIKLTSFILTSFADLAKVKDGSSESVIDGDDDDINSFNIEWLNLNSFLNNLVIKLLMRYINNKNNANENNSTYVEKINENSLFEYFETLFKTSTSLNKKHNRSIEEMIDPLEFCFNCILPLPYISVIIQLFHLDHNIEIKHLFSKAIVMSLSIIEKKGFHSIKYENSQMKPNKETLCNINSSSSLLFPPISPLNRFLSSFWFVDLHPIESTGSIFIFLQTYKWLLNDSNLHDRDGSRCDVYDNAESSSSCLEKEDETLSHFLNGSMILNSLLPTYINKPSNPQVFIKYINKNINHKRIFLKWCSEKAIDLINLELNHDNHDSNDNNDENDRLIELKRANAIRGLEELKHHKLGCSD